MGRLWVDGAEEEQEVSVGGGACRFIVCMFCDVDGVGGVPSPVHTRYVTSSVVPGGENDSYLCILLGIMSTNMQTCKILKVKRL